MAFSSFCNHQVIRIVNKTETVAAIFYHGNKSAKNYPILFFDSEKVIENN